MIASSAELTGVERQVIGWLPTRLSFAEIGQRVDMSAQATRVVSIALYRRLGVVGRREAILRCAELGLLPGVTAGQDDE